MEWVNIILIICLMAGWMMSSRESRLLKIKMINISVIAEQIYTMYEDKEIEVEVLKQEIINLENHNER